MQVDSGANVHAVTSKQSLCFFIPALLQVETVNGDMSTSKGWGGIFVQLLGTKLPFLCCPVHVCPHNLRNTLSLSTLKSYANFDKAMINTHSMVELCTTDGTVYSYPTCTYNGLDFIDIQVMSFTRVMWLRKYGFTVFFLDVWTQSNAQSPRVHALHQMNHL